MERTTSPSPPASWRSPRIVMFAAIALVSAVLAVRVYSSIESAPASRQPRTPDTNLRRPLLAD